MSLNETTPTPVCPNNLGKIWESSIKGNCTGAYFSGGLARACPSRLKLSCPVMFGNAPLPTEEVAVDVDTKESNVNSSTDVNCPPEAR